jgi:hypothetical protein
MDNLKVANPKGHMEGSYHHHHQHPTRLVGHHHLKLQVYLIVL